MTSLFSMVCLGNRATILYPCIQQMLIVSTSNYYVHEFVLILTIAVNKSTF